MFPCVFKQREDVPMCVLAAWRCSHVCLSSVKIFPCVFKQRDVDVFIQEWYASLECSLVLIIDRFKQHSNMSNTLIISRWKMHWDKWSWSNKNKYDFEGIMAVYGLISP